MQLDKYKGVIKRVYAKAYSDNLSFEEFYARLIDSLEIAADLMGDVALAAPAPAPKPVSIETLRKQQATGNLNSAIDAFKGAILLSSAPPVAGACEDDDTPEDDIDYYESKPGKGDGANRLQQKLQSVMPQSIQIKLPGFDEPLTLVCGIGSPGTKFAHVNYSLQGSHEMGPRVTVMTSKKDIDPDAILKDIIEQAGAMYSKEKRVLQPHAAAPQAPPTNQELQNMLARDRANQPAVSSEDTELAEEWRQSRGVQWR